ncbi:LOW QUALITY PROTEIN: hypothetical protein PoB_001186600 [Plakobranchus ocellatus]|uniref:Uncharacterized protein n=1 Tax=Plakobranchus ocellatus TaxID=259542 RepID=A0AAV3YSH9_9GAST|nr:LOW QUALITY PROTEIN: hypothetical protein PoB_001186600 [Plakobranchus ocellatus]
MLDKGKEWCHYVTMHNATDHCRANHEASLVTQIIKPNCSWVEHSKRRPTLAATQLVMANLKDRCRSYCRPTLEAAVHVSNKTCFEILSFFATSAHQVGYLSDRRSYPLCFTAWSYVSGAWSYVSGSFG